MLQENYAVIIKFIDKSTVERLLTTLNVFYNPSNFKFEFFARIFHEKDPKLSSSKLKQIKKKRLSE
jgi:hypothetical protein